MAKTLTLDQVAKRAATKRNNKTIKKLPLLAAQDALPDEWLTTAEEQQKRIERQRLSFEKWWEQHEQRKKDHAILAERYKAECQELASEELFDELLRGAHYTEHLDPVCALDYWHTQLARLDPRYCPHFENNHMVCRALKHNQCPVCLQKVELDKSPTQISLF